MISIIKPSVFSGGNNSDEDERNNNFIPLGGNIIRIIRIKSIPREEEEENNMADDENVPDPDLSEFEDEMNQIPDDFNFSELEDDLNHIPDDDKTLDELPDVNIDELDADDFDVRDEEEDFEGMESDL